MSALFHLTAASASLQAAYAEADKNNRELARKVRDTQLMLNAALTACVTDRAESKDVSRG